MDEERSEPTITYQSTDGGGGQEVPARGPYLVLAINGERPLAGATRISLANADRVNLKRAPERWLQRIMLHGERVCQIGIADPTLSAGHAFLAPGDGGHYWIWDCGSKNGTSLNGTKVPGTARLFDGDLIGVGCTFFIYRSAGEILDHVRTDSKDALFHSLHPQASQAFERAARVAKSALPFLLTGEPGTGRRSTARAMHERSGRGDFVEVSAPDFLENLSALRSAHGGTLYLRDIDGANGEVASAILRAVEIGELVDEDSTALAVRLIGSGASSAVTTMPEQLGSLFGANTMALPPLRHRREDVGDLVASSLADLGAAPETRLRRSVARALLSYQWPGNIGELREAIRTGLAYSKDSLIQLEGLPPTVRVSEEKARERRRLSTLLETHKGNVSAVAKELGTARAQVHRLMDRFGFDVEVFRGVAR